MTTHRLHLWWRRALRHRAIAAAAASVLLLSLALTVRPSPRLTAAAVAGGGGAAAPPLPPPVALTAVRNARSKGAVCLDGSAPQYHLDRGSGAGADSWLLHLEGGGWCSSTASCSRRSRTPLGSSRYMDPVVFYGILSPFRSQNPDFYNWNRVKVRYCDGGSFYGDVEGELHNGTKLFFRGRRIWEAIMSDLISKGLGDAKRAFLTGCSAGGLATFLHCDRFRQLLPKVGTVKCLADAGFFLDEKDVSGKMTMQSRYRDVVQLQNVEKSLHKDCLSATEPAQIQNVLAPDSSDPQQQWLRCKLNIQNCDANQIQFLQGFRTAMLDALKDFQNNKQGGIYINSCFIHCQTLNNITWHSPESPRINNKTIAEAVGDWYFDKREVKEVDCAYPCNPTCYNVNFDGV